MLLCTEDGDSCPACALSMVPGVVEFRSVERKERESLLHGHTKAPRAIVSEETELRGVNS